MLKLTTVRKRSMHIHTPWGNEWNQRPRIGRASPASSPGVQETGPKSRPLIRDHLKRSEFSTLLHLLISSWYYVYNLETLSLGLCMALIGELSCGHHYWAKDLLKLEFFHRNQHLLKLQSTALCIYHIFNNYPISRKI